MSLESTFFFVSKYLILFEKDTFPTSLPTTSLRPTSSDTLAQSHTHIRPMCCCLLPPLQLGQRGFLLASFPSKSRERGCWNAAPREDAEPHTLYQSHALRKIKPSGVLASNTKRQQSLPGNHLCLFLEKFIALN